MTQHEPPIDDRTDARARRTAAYDSKARRDIRVAGAGTGALLRPPALLVIFSGMSTRTTLKGCSLTKIRQLIGTVDDAFAERIRRWLAEEVGDFDGEDEDDEDDGGPPSRGRQIREATTAILARIKGQPAAEVEDEGYTGYLVADALRHRVDGDNAPRTPFEVKNAFWFELLDNYAKPLGPDAQLFDYLAEGRPLFGQTNTDATYACFDREEAIRLRDAARRVAALPGVPEEIVEILIDEHEGLAPCIDRILAAGYDLWTEAS